MFKKWKRAMTKGGSESRSPAQKASWYKQKQPGGGALARPVGLKSSSSYFGGIPYWILISESSSRVREQGMVSSTKIGRGSSTELRFWGAGTDELLELLEEEVLEDILNQVKTLKISKKLRKIRIIIWNLK